MECKDPAWSGSLTVALRYKLDLRGVQEVSSQKGNTLRAGDYNFFYGKGNGNHQLGTGFFLRHTKASAVQRVEFVIDRMSYIVLRGRLCSIIVLNVHATGEVQSDDSKDSFYEELEQGFYYFPKYNIKNLRGDFNENVGEGEYL